MSLKDNIKELYSSELLLLLAKIGEIASVCKLRAYVVGGFVRDLLLRKANYDIDIMVEGDAIPFATAVSEELKAECKLIERFHTAHIYLPDLTIDFSSARKEIYPKPAMLPEISFSTITDDLFRRDFTINAIAMSINPETPFALVDFCNGAKDLTDGIIRVLHSKSFIDDPTRLYRALRFENRFKFTFDDETAYLFDKAINLNMPALLSPKRIASEIDKCFQEERPLTLLTKYQSSGLLAFYHKSFAKIKRPDFSFSVVKATATRLSRTYKNISESAIYWSLLLSKIPSQDVIPLLNASGLPHSVVQCVSEVLVKYKSVLELLPQTCDKIGIYKLFQGINGETMALLMLTSKDRTVQEKISLYLNELHFIKPLAKGKDLIKAGIEPGPQIPKIFEQIIVEKLNGNLITRKEEIDFAKRISNL